jgi:hypothetical protein
MFVGVVGRVSAAIRAGGIGEIVYEQLGARKSAPARSEDGDTDSKTGRGLCRPLRKGIAYVRRWEDLPEIGEGSKRNREYRSRE